MKKLVLNIFNLIFSIIFFIICYFLKLFINKKSEIYLIGSNYGTKRSDNAWILYNYIKSLGKEVYFIENTPIDKNNLKRGSFKSFIYYFKSNGVFYSHSFSDILPEMHKVGRIIKYFGGPKKVFIQHGVMGLKNIDSYIKSLDNSIDLFIVSSQWEKNIIEKIGISKEKIKITGLPRFDKINDIEKEKKVLIFLTWKESELYLKKIKEILEVITNFKYFKKNGYSLKIAIHDMMNFDLGIEQKYLTNDLGKEVREASILITDDSSVAWDFFYNGREVIFYKPEEEWYINKEFLNKKIVKSKKQLKDKFQKIIKNKPKQKITKELFEYIDRSNSQRVFQILNQGLTKEILKKEKEKIQK